MIQQLIRMKCIDPKRNSYRNYEIITIADDSRVITRWGRIGSINTRRKNYVTSTPQEQTNLINRLIRIRLSHGYSYSRNRQMQLFKVV